MPHRGYIAAPLRGRLPARLGPPPAPNADSATAPLKTYPLMAQTTLPNAANSGSLSTNARAQLRWERHPGLTLAILDRPPIRELELTLNLKTGDSIGDLIGRLAEVLKRHQAAVVRQFVFGPVAAYAGTREAMRRLLGEINWPVTWVEGTSCGGGPIAGVQVHAVAGARIQTLTHDGRMVGRVFDDGEAKHCLLGDVGPAHAGTSAPEQARETFENLEVALGLAGMTMKDVARTWLFLDDILSWYAPFNAVRNACFARAELRPGSFPASTGVGGRNPRGTALVTAAWAVRPHHGSVPVQVVPSPKQCPAPVYGSAFSRAVEIASPGCRHLLVSGTASIGPEGQTAHGGDPGRQIERTMEVVSAILQSRGQTFDDVTRATAYFKSAADFPLFTAWGLSHGQGRMPVVAAGCDICRDDLLFEIELDAVKCF
jgi:enamine deaminase RidA (YjgF/YER057c/UK114 family)